MGDTGYNLPAVTVSEVDGTPKRAATQELEFPNGSVTITGTKATVSFTGALTGTYVRIIGDVMTGDLEFPVTGYIMNDGASRWRVTINSSGAIVTTLITVTPPVTGNPIGTGWLMFVTYA